MRLHLTLFTTTAMMVGLCTAGTMAENEIKVHVRQAPVRDNHAALARVVSTLKFAEVVQVTDRFGSGWVKISARAASINGWLRNSAITDKELHISKDGSSGSASQTEMTLAGQGAAEAKRQYVADKNIDAALRKVQALEEDPTTQVSIDEIIQFLRGGNVTPTEGH